MSRFILNSDMALRNFRGSGVCIYQGLGGYTRPRLGVGRRMGAMGSGVPLGINYQVGVFGRYPRRGLGRRSRRVFGW